MKISIFGMGYVGVVSAACLASEGHTVVGVDPNGAKVGLINEGKTPIVEKGLGELLARAVADKLLQATSDAQEAVAATDISFICVGTPSEANGSLDLKYVRRVCEEIGEALKGKTGFHIVVARSTMLPGTVANTIIPTLEAHSGKTAGVDFGVCSNPEFLREGTAVFDYRNPPKTVVGASDEVSAESLIDLYRDLNAPLINTDIATAEMVKYTDNVWHALKVGFANEIGNICKEVGIDGHAVMDIFSQDTKLNLSSYYMKPGFAFGGSCLPKDVRALNYRARTLDLDTPIISSILPNNENQVKRGLDLIIAKGNKKISILGFSFKAGTDDLRESPVVELIERLIGKGYDLRIYDKNVNLAKLVGANRDYIFNAIPHISRLMVDTVEEAVSHGETIVVGNGSEEFREIMSMTSEQQLIVDLVRIAAKPIEDQRYDGICW